MSLRSGSASDSKRAEEAFERADSAQPRFGLDDRTKERGLARLQSLADGLALGFFRAQDEGPVRPEDDAGT